MLERLKINKINPHSTVDFAAEELRKYLRMMMPECGNIEIHYAPYADDGFRLGLMQDFGLDISDAEEPELDDILYIDTDENGGIIAGDNPRSVLLSVYEYLRQNGCRWLMPGVDGEYIPMRDITPVKYRHKPSLRCRGWCNEGSQSQSQFIDAIDFIPKVGMNAFMIEFFIPTHYYSRYYEHTHNEEHKAPEPVSNSQVLQWKRASEAELAKRSLQLHDIGHGWGCESFGIDSLVKNADSTLSSEVRGMLALVNGRRALPVGEAKNSQICMSNAAARALVVKKVIEHARKTTNADYIHIWLGDGMNNHCECDRCRKKPVSDWYVILLNEIDEALSAAGLETRIVFIVYNDTIWAPAEETIKNEKRFTLLLATINRFFTRPLERPEIVAVAPYERNNIKIPKDYSQTFSHLMNWKRSFSGASISYDYHFWRYQYLDVTGIKLASVINGDIKFYEEVGIGGAIEDGSQRSFFPTGYPFYTYARTLFDSSLSCDEIKEEYFSTAFGKDWKLFCDYLERLGDAFDYAYMTGERSKDNGRTNWYNPDHAEKLLTALNITEEGKRIVESHYNSDFRVQTVSVRLVERHIEYARLLSCAMIEKARGNDAKAKELFNEMRIKCGMWESYFETFYDHGMAFRSLKHIFESKAKSDEPVIF